MPPIDVLKSWLGRGWRFVQGPAIRFLIAIGLIGTSILLFTGSPFGERTTLGSIVVDSPEIYTRERLVNDRFLQEAWLYQELQRASGAQGALSFRTERRGLGLNLGQDERPADAPVGEEKPAAGEQTAAPRLSKRSILMQEVAYRDVIRNLTIENQLDDRHDLNGNSLYKLKFDAAVLPGTNTQAGAQVTVSLLGPPFVSAEPPPNRDKSLDVIGSPKDVNAWRTVYLRWIESLRSRLNQTQRELKLAYHNSELSHNDYARLIDFLSRHLRILPGELPSCKASMLEHRGQDVAALPLGALAHAERKKCIEEMVGRSISKTATALPGQGESLQGTGATLPKLGEYITGKDAHAAQRTLGDVERRAMTNVLLDHWLNSFFAGKTVKLVLGVAVPEAAFVNINYYKIQALTKLARLTFFNTIRTNTLQPDQFNEGSQDARDGTVFSVTERSFSIVAIEPGKVTQKDLENAAAIRPEIGNPVLADFSQIPSASLGNFAVYQPHLRAVQADELKLGKGDFTAIGGAPGVHIAAVEPGLINFALTGRQHNQAFIYAVTPKESADTISTAITTDSQVDGRSSLPAGKGAVSAQARRLIYSQALEQRPVVVGFADIPKEGRTAEFGWRIYPSQTKPDGQALAYVHVPAQYSLSALVSLPAWWSTVRLQVATSWIGKDGATIVAANSPIEFGVDLPVDFEPLETLLLGIEQIGPELMEARLDPVLLTACRSGSILIPGRRLWRSTKVTLGFQQADAISVLPNMKGIIATFYNVENQLSFAEEYELRRKNPEGRMPEIQRPVRVWTSQGSLTLPSPASIGIPNGCVSSLVAGFRSAKEASR